MALAESMALALTAKSDNFVGFHFCQGYDKNVSANNLALSDNLYNRMYYKALTYSLAFGIVLAD